MHHVPVHGAVPSESAIEGHLSADDIQQEVARLEKKEVRQEPRATSQTTTTAAAAAAAILACTTRARPPICCSPAVLNARATHCVCVCVCVFVCAQQDKVSQQHGKLEARMKASSYAKVPEPVRRKDADKVAELETAMGSLQNTVAMYKRMQAVL